MDNKEILKVISDAVMDRSDDQLLTAAIELRTGNPDRSMVSPPTYEGNTINVEKRWSEKEQKWTWVVVLDSIASKANRMEEAAQTAYEQGNFAMPNVFVDSKFEKKSVNQLPHRIWSAYIRDSVDSKGVKFSKTLLGQTVYNPSKSIAYPAILNSNPLALIFGFWASKVSANNNCIKQHKAIRASIIGSIEGGKEENLCNKVGGMIDPYQMPGVFIAMASDYSSFKILEKGGEDVKASKSGYSSVPPTLTKTNVSATDIREDFEFDFRPISKIKFGNHDEAIRTMLVTMGLYAHVLSTRDYHLRTGTNLITKKAAITYLVHSRNGTTKSFDLERAQAFDLYESTRKNVPVELYDVNRRVDLQLTDEIVELIYKKKKKQDNGGD